jgi:hypothetical protein
MQKNKILVKIYLFPLLTSFGLLTYHPMTKYYPSARVFILLVIIAALYACKKDPYGAFDPTQTYVLSAFSRDNGESASYEYNDQHQLIKSIRKVRETRRLISTYETTYYYNNEGRLIRDVVTYKGERTWHISNEYEYNSEGRLALINHYNDDNNHAFMNKNEYSYSGNKITEKMIRDTIISRVIVSTVDNEGNIVKRVTDEREYSTGDLTEEWFGYDNKKNITGTRAGDVMSKNNPARYVVREPYGMVITYTYLYRYSPANYVTKLVSHSSSGDYSTASNYEYIPVN